MLLVSFLCHITTTCKYNNVNIHNKNTGNMANKLSIKHCRNILKTTAATLNPCGSNMFRAEIQIYASFWITDQNQTSSLQILFELSRPKRHNFELCLAVVQIFPHSVHHIWHCWHYFTDQCLTFFMHRPKTMIWFASKVQMECRWQKKYMKQL